MTPGVRAAVLGLTAILVGLPILSWLFFLSHVVPDGYADFRAYYTAGYMLRTGSPIYDYASVAQVQNLKISRAIAPFIHPAYEAFLYVPLSYLTYLQAYYVWFAISILILVCVYRLLQPELSALHAVAPWVPAAMLAAFFPIGAALFQGQDSLLVLLLLTLAFAYFRHSERLVFAGVLLGLAVFRFQIVVPVLFCFLLWRRWKVVMGFLVSSLAAAALSVAVAGFRPYVNIVLGLSLQPEAGYFQGISHMPNLRGLIHSLGGGDWMVLVASLAVLAVAVLAGNRYRLHQQFCLAICAAALVSYHCFAYDLSMLFIPLALLISKKQQAALIVTGICFFASTLAAFVPEYSYLSVFAVLVLFSYVAFRCGDGPDLDHSGVMSIKKNSACVTAADAYDGREVT